MNSESDDETVQVFSRLLVANQRRIYGFILTLVHDRAAAEDILQDVSALLWQKFDKFERGTDFAAWGMAVSRLTILNWRRKQKSVPLPLDDQQFSLLADEAVAVSCEADARHEAMQRCLQKVDPSGRELLTARFEMAQSVTSIADQLGRSRVAIYKRLNRIQSMLLDCINETLRTEGVQ
ncbi:sigma-70 family RNA polymerase sigma factor [Crateriforma conspicua]|uniref:RNA polymerase sigma factor n=1 Tax=Crateriforma conspicua TaxID=2527996 RepID=A0A5C5Y361_9PLAN|nr:sigma-70 family RNA polymerase sigma factor [Crateriforma conspicua]QDV63988.1 RNA polymerase sigma factor [Crateriforma conspicua]TWT69368.1 RNA polymerase sigma factor [Crateriforma conspicua]